MDDFAPYSSRGALRSMHRATRDPQGEVSLVSWTLTPAHGAAAGTGARPARDGAEGPVRHGGSEIRQNVSVKSELSQWMALDDAAFTLPERPSLLFDRETVDLLAEPTRRRVPEGTISGFAALAALVAFSLLVGGPMGGLV